MSASKKGPSAGIKNIFGDISILVKDNEKKIAMEEENRDANKVHKSILGKNDKKKVNEDKRNNKDINVNSIDALNDEYKVSKNVISVPINKLYKSSLNHFKERDEQELIELADNIEANGLSNPIGIRFDSTGQAEIIKGWNRYRAALEIGLTHVECIEMDTSGTEFDLICTLYSDNLKGRTMKHNEEYVVFLEADKYITKYCELDSRGGVVGGKKSVLSKKFGFKVDSAKRYMRIKKSLLDEIESLYISGDITQSAALHFTDYNEMDQKLIYDVLLLLKKKINDSSIDSVYNAITSNNGLSAIEIHKIMTTKKVDYIHTISSRKFVYKPKLSEKESLKLAVKFPESSAQEIFDTIIKEYIGNID